jgi:hypothetical protein
LVPESLREEDLALGWLSTLYALYFIGPTQNGWQIKELSNLFADSYKRREYNHDGI